jgi:transglutaminase-like putative cysteine protease
MMPTSATLDRPALEALPRLSHEDADWERVRRTTYVVRQSVRYEYPGPIRDLRQRLLLVPPRRHGDQHLVAWGLDVSLPARRREWRDSSGNLVLNLEVDRVETAIEFDVWSLVERHCSAGTSSSAIGRHAAIGGPVGRGRHRLAANPALAAPTPLTGADRALAEAARELGAAGHRGVALAERICEWVHRSMVYRHDVTSIDTSAAAALALGAGVCQDYAHIALALCRSCGLPARYVSGHLLGDGGSHAWIEVMTADRDRPSMWRPVALDPTHNRRPGLTYLTVATGRDYRDVAPVSGSYRASVSGRLSVRKQAALVAVVYRDE